MARNLKGAYEVEVVLYLVVPGKDSPAAASAEVDETLTSLIERGDIGTVEGWGFSITSVNKISAKKAPICRGCRGSKIVKASWRTADGVEETGDISCPYCADKEVP